MNIGLILAGGIGIRMKTDGLPKQFLDLYGKPIIIYTLEHFQECADIDYIVVVCVNGWESYLKKKIDFYNLKKVTSIISAGQSRQGSVYNGLLSLKPNVNKNDIVVIHEAVRPMVSARLISQCIEQAKQKGAIVLATTNYETVIEESKNYCIDRNDSFIIKTPQCFSFSKLFSIHEMAMRDKIFDFIDEPHMFIHYNEPFSLFKYGLTENIKITRPEDFYIFKALLEMKQNLQILGL